LVTAWRLRSEVATSSQAKPSRPATSNIGAGESKSSKRSGRLRRGHNCYSVPYSLGNCNWQFAGLEQNQSSR
jgi:hypothetical protein